MRGIKGVRLINNLRPKKGAGFLGIDLTSAETRPSASLGLDRELHLIYSGFPYQDSDILGVVSSRQFELVAIDAPLSLPKGLCCLEESCPCQPTSEGKSRSCERELRKQGIPVFPTTKKTFIKQLIYRGIRLKAKLEATGCRVIEVYPYASKVRLFGRMLPAKSKSVGLAFLKQHISQLLPNIAPHVEGFNHHLYDAAVAAYTAFLHYQGKTKLCGELEEGAIWLPFLDRVAYAD